MHIAILLDTLAMVLEVYHAVLDLAMLFSVHP